MNLVGLLRAADLIAAYLMADEGECEDKHLVEAYDIVLNAARPVVDPPKDYAPMWLDGGGDPSFAQIDGFLYRHFHARAVYIDEADR